MPDIYFDKVVGLYPMAGPNGGTLFYDYSPLYRNITRNNAYITTAQSKYYGSSTYFDRDGDYLYVSYHAGHDLADLPFTLEVWVYPIVLDGTIQGLLGRAYGPTNENCWGVFIDNTNLTFHYGGAAGNVDNRITFPHTMTAGNWYHLAVTRDGSNTLRAFQNGVQIGTDQSLAVKLFNSTARQIHISRPWGLTTGYYFYGYMNDMRITKGVARYTTNFIPPEKLYHRNIYGTVTDDAGNPAVRNVHLLSRLFPEYLFKKTVSDVSGFFSFTDLHDMEYYVVCLDDDAGTNYNAQIFDRVLPL